MDIHVHAPMAGEGLRALQAAGRQVHRQGGERPAWLMTSLHTSYTIRACVGVACLWRADASPRLSGVQATSSKGLRGTDVEAVYAERKGHIDHAVRRGRIDREDEGK